MISKELAIDLAFAALAGMASFLALRFFNNWKDKLKAEQAGEITSG